MLPIFVQVILAITVIVILFSPRRDKKKTLSKQDREVINLVTNKKKRLRVKPVLNIANYLKFNEHRSGWNFVMQSLQTLHAGDQGILVDDFLEHTYGWKYIDEKMQTKDVAFRGKKYYMPKKNLVMYNDQPTIRITGNQIVSYDSLLSAWIPSNIDPKHYDKLVAENPGNTVYTKPWIGFLHNPQNMPTWCDFTNSPQMILRRPEFQESLKCCKGILVFSEYLAKWLRTCLPPHVPVSVLYHPTDTVDIKMFDPVAFKNNTDRHVIQIGYWLRVLHAIYMLEVPQNYKKMWLFGGRHALEIFDQEKQYIDQSKVLSQPVEVTRLSNEDYDEALSKNVGFIELYDSSCNNAVVECIARATPILVNKIAPVVEYLGEDYPLYYNTLEQATELLADDSKLLEAHYYLLNRKDVRRRVDVDAFFEDFVNSEVYANCIRTKSK